MEEITIEELTRILIQQDFKERTTKEYFRVSKKDLIKICLKVVKLMESVKKC